jgi:hypothetical protein
VLWLQVLNDDEEDDATREAYQSLMDLRNRIFDDPSEDLNEWAKKLRQANFKQQYKMRQSASGGMSSSGGLPDPGDLDDASFE